MTVTGTGIKAGTTITGISGTTVTMNQVADISVVGSLATSFSATPESSGSNVIVAAYNVSVSVGQIVTGPGISSTATAKVDSVVLDDPTGDVADQSKKITLTYNVGTNDPGTYYFYNLGSQSAISYTFKGPDTYKISKPGDGALPFGSFPSAGRIK